MAKEAARNEFRRASAAFDHVEKIDSNKVEGILGLLGQPFDQRRLSSRLIQLQDGDGRLDYKSYTRIIDEFVTKQEAIDKMAGDEFSYKHLINRSDFGKP